MKKDDEPPTLMKKLYNFYEKALYCEFFPEKMLQL